MKYFFGKIRQILRDAMLENLAVWVAFTNGGTQKMMSKILTDFQ